MSNICNYCSKEFSNKVNLIRHQTTVKNCLKLQGKNEDEIKVECINCKKLLSGEYYKQHKIKCDLKLNQEKDNLEKNKLYNDLQEKYKVLEKQYKKLKTEVNGSKNINDKLKEELLDSKNINDKLKLELAEIKGCIGLLERQNDRLHSSSTSVTMKLVEKASTVNNYESDSEYEDDSIIPSTVYEKLNETIHTIEDIEEKDNILTLSEFTLNNVTITSRHPDHYVNATQLCQAGNKKFNDWVRLDTTKDLITVLSSDAGIPASLLVDSKRGQTSKFQQGSWIHPDLAIQLAQWISPSFALQVSRWIRELFNNGSITIDIALLKTQEKQLNIKDQRIKQLEDVCLSKQRRVEYKEKNVIYMLTTDDHLKRRTYIFGKAKNLTSRLGTYNKTCDHKVIYYRECKNDEYMSVVETLVLSKLRDYREKANRDRFILPDDKDICFFTRMIDECVDFI